MAHAYLSARIFLSLLAGKCHSYKQLLLTESIKYGTCVPLSARFFFQVCQRENFTSLNNQLQKEEKNWNSSKILKWYFSTVGFSPWFWQINLDLNAPHQSVLFLWINVVFHMELSPSMSGLYLKHQGYSQVSLQENKSIHNKQTNAIDLKPHFFKR